MRSAFWHRSLVTAGVAAMAGLSAMLSGCDQAMVFSGDQGKPLAALDLSGTPPHGVAMLGPDTLRIRTGEKLAITVEGDAATAADLRFVLADGTLGIRRKSNDLSIGDGAAPVTINVTMPAPDALSMAGSGKIFAAALAPRATINIGGSGEIETLAVAADSLSVNIAGSGTYRAAGHAAKLSLNVAGSGAAPMAGLKADVASVSIAGSGNSQFASDGTVSANILGSGDIRVTGHATCTANTVGSGRIVCDSGVKAGTDADKDDDKDEDDKSDGKTDND